MNQRQLRANMLVEDETRRIYGNSLRLVAPTVTPCRVVYTRNPNDRWSLALLSFDHYLPRDLVVEANRFAPAHHSDQQGRIWNPTFHHE